MKLLFVHSHPFLEDKSGKIHSNQFPYDVWGRYLRYCDTLTVFGRRRHFVPEGPSWLESSGHNVRFELEEKAGPVRTLLSTKAVRRRLARLIAEHDGVIVRLPSRFGLEAAALAKKADVPCLVEVVGCARDALKYHGSTAGAIYAPLSEARTRRVISQADYIIYVSKAFLQSRYPPRLGAKCATASNVMLVDLDPKSIVARVARIQAPADTYVLGMIGSPAVKYKGVEVAIRALAEVIRDIPNVELQVVGVGDTAACASLASEVGVEHKVKFLGVLAGGRAVADWLDQVDVYAQPSLTEGLPRSLIEAMSRGCPCIGSDVGGIPELLSGPSIFPSGSHSAMAEAVRRLINDPSQMERLAAENFRKASQFAPERIGHARDTVFQPFVAAITSRQASDPIS